MKKIALVLLTITGIIISLHSCKKDKKSDPDEELYKEVIASGFTYYQNGTLLSAAPESPHGSFKLRLNATAVAALDSTGELPTGHSFPTGSLLVKEVYAGGNLTLYAVMKKDPSNLNAANGWLWAELNTDGSTHQSVSVKGGGCTSCHSGNPNRDFVRTYDFH